MKVSPEIKNDPEYKQARAWLLAGVTMFILGAIFMPQFAVVPLVFGLLARQSSISPSFPDSMKSSATSATRSSDA